MPNIYLRQDLYDRLIREFHAVPGAFAEWAIFRAIDRINGVVATGKLKIPDHVLQPST